MKRIILPLIMLCAAVITNAQSLSEIELNQTRAIWLESGNAAGISTENLLRFKDVSFNFEGEGGAFAHSYDASNRQDYSLKGRTVMDLAGFKLNGSLLLDRSSLKDVPFNCSVYEVSPFTKPYWLLDYSSARYNWNRGSYAADVNVASPLYLDGRLAAGINLKLDAKTAARADAIAADYSSLAIELAPSAIFKIDDSNTVGAALRFSNMPENCSISSADGIGRQVALARGLGQYKMRNLEGANPLGAVSYQNKYTRVSIQYDRNSAGKGSELLLNLGLTKGNSWLYAGEKELTSIDDIRTDFSLIHLKGEHHNRIFTLAASYGMMYGYDASNNPTVHTLESAVIKLLLDYTVYFGTPTTTYSWFMGLRTDGSYLSQKRYLPDGRFTAPEVLASLDLGKNTALSAGSELMCSLKFGYHTSFGATYSFGTPVTSVEEGEEPEPNLISTMLYSDENYFLKQYYYLVAPQVRYSTRINEKLSAYGLLQGSLIKPVEADGVRFIGGLSVGILF